MKILVTENIYQNYIQNLFVLQLLKSKEKNKQSTNFIFYIKRCIKMQF